MTSRGKALLLYTWGLLKTRAAYSCEAAGACIMANVCLCSKSLGFRGPRSSEADSGEDAECEVIR